MDVDSAEGESIPPRPAAHRHPSDMRPDANAQQTTQEGDFPKGSSFFTASIPASLSDPSDEPMDPKDQAKDNLDCRNLFFYLGLCSDVVGFADDGALKFAFDPLPPQLVK
ncbi:hypothetical protein BS50DRAFT_570504 [Corynespora cassiicola Philippines]|uniref:Uncharacterized protein n=1 Tax=Corynespora cassiicola Philippines TaxID=1448308 RepID=A0A2T2P0P9_CORCC|nr:hypothetical protein BS50DRAFT_570504 [Corynespora cassiicola Philippines]